MSLKQLRRNLKQLAVNLSFVACGILFSFEKLLSPEIHHKRASSIQLNCSLGLFEAGGLFGPKAAN